jgi:cytidylate kinase
MIITIDGPAGAGKSTVSRGLARRLDFEFLDTGAMYRAVAWACLQRQINLDDSEKATAVAASLSLEVTEHGIHCNRQNVTEAIRSAEVSHGASIVAAIPGVRTEMVRLQRESADGRNIVTEGRDQGSVVFPDAECKFFVTASPRTRAERRKQELEERGQSCDLEDVLAQIIERDERDRTRSIAPLIEPEDAIAIDSSGITATEVIDRLEAIARERLLPS